MDLSDRHGIITGAGSGIGREIALEFGRRGGHLLLVGRREQPLRDTAALIEAGGGTAHCLPLDLTSEGSIDHLVTIIDKQFTALDLLVNNAGNVRAGRLEDHHTGEITSMIELNLLVPILTTRALLPWLRVPGPRDAILLNITSGMALVGMPYYSVYAATKAGLARFGEALRRELHPSPVHVATVYPGPTATAMTAAVQGGEHLGWTKRSVTDVVTDLFTALAAGEHDINTSPPSSRALQQLNQHDPLAVDTALAPTLAELGELIRNHRSF